MRRLQFSAGAILLALLLALGGSSSQQTTANPETITDSQHVQLGFTASSGFSDTRSDSCCLGAAEYTIHIDGDVQISVDFGADVDLAYEREDLIPGGILDLAVGYTPTDDAGSEVTVSVSTLVDASVCVIEVFCDSQNDIPVNLSSAPVSFSALLSGDAPVVIPLSSNTLTLQVIGVDVADFQLTGNLTLSPVATGVFPGLGGAAAVVSVSGDGTLNSPAIPVLEWQTAGDQAASVSLTGAGETSLNLGPMVHWLATSANLQVNIDLADFIEFFISNPSPITLLSGSLGPQFVAAGLDTLIGNAVAAEIGFDPGFAANIAAGNVPIPLLDPELASIPPLPSLGSVVFSIDLDTDNDGLADGVELTGSNPTDPDDSDSDDDGLLDGEEDANHNGAFDTGETNPNDPDTDDDVLTDGCEVEGVNPTDPLDADSDDDSLTDGFEDANHNCAQDAGETDPNDFDSDDDGLSDGVEVEFGTDPLDADSDDDGIPDGQDVEFLENAINALADDAFKGIGNRQAALDILKDAEKSVEDGKVDHAIKKLEDLLQRIDGCGTEADQDDWIVDCDAQMEIRELVELLIDNLSP